MFQRPNPAWLHIASTCSFPNIMDRLIHCRLTLQEFTGEPVERVKCLVWPGKVITQICLKGHKSPKSLTRWLKGPVDWEVQLIGLVRWSRDLGLCIIIMVAINMVISWSLPSWSSSVWPSIWSSSSVWASIWSSPPSPLARLRLCPISRPWLQPFCLHQLLSTLLTLLC